MIRLESLLVHAIVVATLGVGIATTAAAAPPNLALLVGCTEYPNHPGLRELYGPGNDAPMWAALLTDPTGLAFPQDKVTQLVGWPAVEAQRPTYANIVKGFDNLIAKAEPDSRIVIVLSGHGVQVPIPPTQEDPLDPRNPEPDGLDEVFLPADVGDWSESGLKNAILDDQIGVWLDELRAKGAHVLIVFDCCHSGTMTRGGSEVREISRVASAAALGIKNDAIQEAVGRARQAVADAEAAGRQVPAEVTVKAQDQKGRGSLVAFYAAQPFEEAPELPFPEDAAKVPDNYYGMLSWTLIQAIRSRQSPLTYGELLRLVSARYRSSRGTRPPTPFAEGDLSREVLGLNVWPSRPTIYVRKDTNNELRLDAGELQGLTPNSILSVLPPPNDNRDLKTVIGYLRIASATPSTAYAVPLKRAETKNGPDWQEAPADVERIPDSARCEILVRDLGEMRLKLFTRSDAVKAALDKMAAEVKELIRVIPGEADADWLLGVVSPGAAEKDYGIGGLAEDQVFLVHGAGRALKPEESSPTVNAEVRQQPPKVFSQYPLTDEKALLGGLQRDLPKIFKWQNLWRVAGGVNAIDGGETHGLVFGAYKLRHKNAPEGEVLRSEAVPAGQILKFTLKNEGLENLWVTMLYLDANLGIRDFSPGQIQKGSTLRPYFLQLTDEHNSTGQEGMIVFAIPASVQNDRPDFTFLEQEPLRVAEARARSMIRAPETPFGRLLKAVAFNERSRGGAMLVSTTPAILSHSWVLVSKPKY